MTRLLTLYPLEVIANALQDHTRLALAEFPDNPFAWIAILFAVVARLAGGKNIAEHVSAAFCHWNVMLLLQRRILIKERCSVAAVSANAVPIFKRRNPVLTAKGCRKITLFHFPPCSCGAPYFGMLSLPAPSFFISLDLIPFAPYASAPPKLLSVFQAALAISFSHFFSMAIGVFALAKQYSIWVIGAILALPQTMLEESHRIIVSPRLSGFVIAFFALMIQSVGCLLDWPWAEVSVRLVKAAFRAAFQGVRSINHSASLSLSPVMRVTRAAGLATFSGIGLDHTAYFTARGGVLQ